MPTKLTLSMSDFAIEKAKKIAKQRHTSISKMVEGFFTSLDDKSAKEPLDARVKRTAGKYSLPKSISSDDLKKKYLMEKYLK
jgi:hypothetical protein